MDNKHIKSQLNRIQEQQFENEQQLKEHEQLEQEIHELKSRSRRLFNELMDEWQKDETLAPEVNRHRSELLHHEAEVNKKLVDKKAAYLKTKRDLFDLEEALYSEQRRYIYKEDKT